MVKVDAKTKTVLDEYKGTLISAVTAVSELVATHVQIFKAEHFELKCVGFSNKYNVMNNSACGVNIYFCLWLMQLRQWRVGLYSRLKVKVMSLRNH